jgi:hypothetical protein
MRPSGDNDESDDLLEDTTTDDNTSNQEGIKHIRYSDKKKLNNGNIDSSVASEDAEEQAYLRDIQQSIKVTSFTVPDTTTPYGSPDRSMLQRRQSAMLTRNNNNNNNNNNISSSNRPGSVASVQTMVTAPTTPRQLPLTRPPSAATSVRTGTSNSNKRRPVAQMTARDDLRGNLLEEEYIDTNVNPWQQVLPSITHDSGASSSEEETQHYPYRHGRRSKTPNGQLRLPSPMYHTRRLGQLSSPPLNPQVHGMTPIQQSQFQSPVFGSSTSSSVTATPQNNTSRSSSRMVYTPTNTNERPNSRLFDQPRQPNLTTVALGPATKRALESLQNEVIALNDRIDDLRRELVERDIRRSAQQDTSSSSSSNNSEGSTDDFNTDNWKWVIKVHTAMCITIEKILILLC